MKYTAETPFCYGSPQGDSDRCCKCEFRQSCGYFAATSRPVISRSHLTSYNAIGSWLPESADYDHIPGKEPEDDAGGITWKLSTFFHYLLSLDDYALGIVCEVVDPENRHPGGRCTISSLGNVHGCSRQAMHRKILQLIAERPELSMLLKSTMYKLSAARKRFIRKRAAEQCLQG